MENIFKKSLIFFCLTIFLITPFFVFAEDEAKCNSENIFYLSVSSLDNGIKSIDKNWEKIDILAPQMHVVGTNLKVSGNLGAKLEKVIKKYNLKVMPLIVNTNFNQKIIHDLLVSKSAQDKVINTLIKGAKTNGYIGWQFDFENISYKDKDLYSAFVERANKAFKKNDLMFSVTVVARTVDFEDTNGFKNWSGAYDYKRIADASDFVSLMAYDDPNSRGPTASVAFVKSALDYAKDKIPAEKLSLGVPLYYWKWNADTNKRVGSGIYASVFNIMVNFRHILKFDEGLGVACLTYSSGSKNYKVWFENKDSFELKLSLIEENNLRGFSAWVLGGEDPAIWGVL